MFDVAVVGAGPAGTTVATRLARAGRSVALLEASHFERDRPGEHLAPIALRHLDRLDFPRSGLAPFSAPSFGVDVAWGTARLQPLSALRDPEGSALRVIRHKFDEWLAFQAASCGADLRVDNQVISCERVGMVWRLSLGRGGTVAARTVVDASGRRSTIAEPGTAFVQPFMADCC